ncbi:ribonucleoside-diphosphate reductase subunit alpha [Bacillus cereus]|uniref:ribonucleoside-diphosphate reductase subunit alpha n=2 Tax=Bacillus TaxID=1386 RepID=UPI001443D13B|nr:ribonucleoside-diphosphate reductase subunit alpha [Bacillus cereus]NKW77392.1 ribonucleoside-diphosphate reductase subunit alpha [Bacillus cereus]NKX14809.1 ribonucleoside-diphosphate reductase subunit alpha [Bacillus cereus]
MTLIMKEDGKRQLPFDEPRLRAFIQSITSRFPSLDTKEYEQRVIDFVKSKKEYKAEQITNRLIKDAMDRIGIDNGQHPDWTYIASAIYLRSMYKAAAKNRVYDPSEKYGSFYSLIKTLTTQGVYDAALLRDYTKEEINELGECIDAGKDEDFEYIALRTLGDRYLATDHSKNIYELPQERFLIIAMTLMQQEDRSKRLELVKESYWALSNRYMTVATPTLANAGKSHGQLSSCFIDTIGDSLQGIYDSNTDVANLSKGGGGIGTYWGFVRAKGSTIKGYKGIGGGIVPWLKMYNQTAVSVDQLGQRPGAIVAWLPVWHKDIFPFLDLKLNNGDERLRAHDLFQGLVIPDVFMEQVEKRGEWYLFDPKEVFDKKGYYLDNFYDEKKGSGSFREKYWECVNDPNLSKVRIDAIEIIKSMLKSQLETGTPYMFYRDEANRKNPNKHAGMIYCSNLCVEIMQNMSATVFTESQIDEEYTVIRKQNGDFVTCNLSSINLGKAVPDKVLERLIRIQVRMLDNVIDLNEDRIEVKQAVATNRKYRAIGLGTFGWHHLLALKGIKWESEESVEFADKLYEMIAYYTIQASMELAKEKGAYPVFEGSDWATGEYFLDRGYVGATREYTRWHALMDDVSTYGIRNGYLMAVAPNGSTSIIGGSTASIDPIFKREYAEEKKDYKIPVTAPDLGPQTYWYYKTAWELDQNWSIKQNAARQRHIDQSQSFNLYVKNDIPAPELLGLHMAAWKAGLKTTYYLRSTAIEIEECESCSS